MSIKRVNAGKGHSYKDTETGQKIPGVTTILKAMPKDALIGWAASATANYAIDHWEELGEKALSVRLKELTGARYADSDKASNRGNQVHTLASKLVHGERVKVPDEIAGHVRSYTRFLDDFDVRPVLVEAVVANRKHRYCGTLDLLGDLLDVEDPDGGYERWLIDIKTSRSGVYPESALQLAGYRYAELYVDAAGEEHLIPEVTRTGVVHVRADGYDLVPVEAGQAEFRQLLYVQQTHLWGQSSRELIGAPIVPPTTSTYDLVRLP